MEVRTVVAMLEGGKELRFIVESPSSIEQISELIEKKFGKKVVGIFSADAESGKLYMYLDFTQKRVK